mmetsp:Transcript_68805/g.191981  ORF Transcript_68805/g.191981 Transcript_68805/m.191981 type:complete len:1156 (-) Transcript_68805:1192-4659(-)
MPTREGYNGDDDSTVAAGSDPNVDPNFPFDNGNFETSFDDLPELTETAEDPDAVDEELPNTIGPKKKSVDELTEPTYTLETLAVSNSKSVMLDPDEDATPPATGPEEETAIDDLSDSNGSLKAGQNYFLVSSRWWRQWKQYTTRGGQRPGPIDNSSLLQDSLDDTSDTVTLRRGVMERTDYYTLGPEAWDQMAKWYGGGPVIKRQAFANRGQASIDLYGINMKVKRTGDSNIVLEVNSAKWATIEELKSALCWHFKIDPDHTRFWDYYSGRRYALLDIETKTLQQVNVTENQEMMLEEARDDGKFDWPDTPDQGGGSSYVADSGVNMVTSSQTPAAPGLVGLANLGNTCFMNSILQCTSNMRPLRDLFVSGGYKDDLNEDNPLGHNGKLAAAYGNLMEMVYSGQGNKVAPRGFKKVIGEFEPQFQGFNQHDSQELLNFLLDGLHEDLNRINNKPYTEPVEANGRDDATVAAECLETHKKRNDSHVFDLFGGQFKSVVICPEATCKYVSKTFDPFMLVSLPLNKATATEQHFDVSVLDKSGSHKTHSIKCPKEGAVLAIRVAVSQASGVALDKLVLAELFMHQVHKVFKDCDNISEIQKGDILAAYEIDDISAYWPTTPTEWEPHPAQEEWGKSEDSDEEDEEMPELETGSEEKKDDEADTDAHEEKSADVSAAADAAPDAPDGDGADAEKVPPPPPANDTGAADDGDASGSGGGGGGDNDGGVADNNAADSELVTSVYAAAAAAAEFAGASVVEERVNPWTTGDVWSGNYQSGTSVRNCRFTVVSSEGNHVRLVFDFENHRHDQGAFAVSGDFDKATGEVLLKPECWVKQLGGMTQVRFRMGPAHCAPGKDEEDAVCWGEVLHHACGPIVMWKIPGEVAKAAESVPLPALVSAEGDDAPDVPSVSVQVTHKRSEVKRYSAASTPTVIRHKIGTPIVLSVKGSATSGEVRSMIEERVKAMGANTDLPHKLVRASKHGEEDPRYHKPAGSRVGEEVPTDAEDAEKAFLPPSHDGVIKLVMSWGEVKEESEVFPDAKGGPDATAEEEKESNMQLSSCFDLFTVQEQLSEQDAWYCPRCKEHKQAFKKMDIWSAPPILALHFKRFSVDASSFWTEKLETAVKFPLELDISKYAWFGVCHRLQFDHQNRTMPRALVLGPR